MSTQKKNNNDNFFGDSKEQINHGLKFLFNKS